jgi:hypothetical protein
VIYVIDAEGSTNVTTGANIYIQSAQLETGLVSTDYLDSTSVTGKAGVLVDLPRINYDANGENGSLLLEPSRLQMLKYSEYANEWDVDSNVTTTINAATSPEGVLNAVKLEGLTTSANNQIFRFIGSNTGVSVVGKTFSCSLYIKPVNPNDVGKNIELSIQRTAGDYEGLNQTFEIDSADWKRYDLSYTFTGAGSGNQTGVTFKVLRNSTTIDDIYCFGAQCEEASYPSSYIPNHGESGGITRAADDCSKSGIQSVIGQTEGTLFFEGKADHTPQNVSILNFDRQTSFSVCFVKRSDGRIQVQIFNGGSSVVLLATSGAVDGFFKMAFAYKSGDSVLYVNGSEVQSSSTTFTPAANVDELYLGSYQSPYFAYDYPVECKEAAVFKERLTNEELATLTTL